MIIALGVDLAISEKASADWTAACVMGRDDKGDVHILEVQRVRTSFRQQQEFIKQLAAKWNPHIIGIEDVAYQKSMVQEISATTTYRVVGVKPDRDKIARFAPLESRYELGQVWHVQGLIPEFERELLSFGAEVDHDDMVDAMSIAWAALDMPRPEYSYSYSGGGVVSSGPGF
jgi:predicted phage terminase large subunit-like protein